MNEIDSTRDNGIGAYILIPILLFIVFFALWIWMIVYATRKKGVLGFCPTFFLGLIGWIIVLFLPADKERERERDEKFTCGICYIKYREELLGEETAREGKICRFCLEKKQSGAI